MQKFEISLCDNTFINRTNRRGTSNYDRESSDGESNYLEELPSQTDFYANNEIRNSKDREIDPCIFERDQEGNKLQLIEKLEIGRSQEDDSETNIVNGFDDSLTQEQLNTNFPQNNRYEKFTSYEQKSRNYKGLNKKFKVKGIKTTANMKENISDNSSNLLTLTLLDTFTKNDVSNSFGMNQNHLHLHVNVTNSDFRYFNKSGQKSTISDHELSGMENSSSIGFSSSRNKKISRDKIKIKKKNNLQYTPLTINGILKDSSDSQNRVRDRMKTKSGDLSAMSLSSS